MDIRQDALNLAEELKKEEEIDADPEEQQETVVKGELQEAYDNYKQRKREEDPKLEVREGKKRLVELDSADVSAIVESEKNELLSHKAIAAKHNISTALVGRVIRAARKDKEYLKKRQQSERKKAE